jgi:hypothetical protein
VNKKTYKELVALAEALSDKLGMDMSISKTIEHLATQKAKQMKLNGHSKS